MTDDDLNKLAAQFQSYEYGFEHNTHYSFDYKGFARAIEQASRRTALEEAAKTVGALHEKISAQEIIGFDVWSAGHLALDNAACHIRNLAKETNNERPD